MTKPDRLRLVHAATRTAVVELMREGGTYALPSPLDWTLHRDGVVAARGHTDRHVFTLCGLAPDTPYLLASHEYEPLPLRTMAETALVSIRDHGANPDADDNSAAIQAAIAAAPEGATVVIPPGPWASGPLFLKSHLTLLLEKGATLKGLADRRLYPALPAYDASGRMLGSWEGEPAATYASLLTAIGATNLTITGEGVIDGNAAAGDWWDWPKETRNGLRRPRTLFFSGCRDITITGIAVRNSPSWTIHPLDCEGVLAADLLVENPKESPNTDGLNPESSRHIRILGVHFSVGDDCIAIKAGKRGSHAYPHRPTSDVEIRRCLMEFGHGGVVIGSEMSGGVEDVRVANCRFVNTDRGLRIKTRRGRGGHVRHVSFADVEMDGVLTPLSINGFYFCDPDGRSPQVQSRTPAPIGEDTPAISDISFTRVSARNVHHAAAHVLGLTEAPVERLVIADYVVAFAPEAEAGPPDMASDLPDLRHAGIVIANATAPEVSGVTFLSEPSGTPP
ncbi:glycoside hydrolase family 28 protein [Devosia enhydra]|nr:glycoside hydrolase family 28 protein [Devosia enhydra]